MHEQLAVSAAEPSPHAPVCTALASHPRHEVQLNPSPKYPALQEHAATSALDPAWHALVALACGSQALHWAQFLPSP